MIGDLTWGKRVLGLWLPLLALFVFGGPVEERMGGRQFLTYYLLCGLGGAALSFLLMQFRPVELVIGASAAVYGVMLAFAWAWPNQPIYVFPFPEPIAAKWLVTFAVGISLVLALIPTRLPTSRTWAGSPPGSCISRPRTCAWRRRSGICGAPPSRASWFIRRRGARRAGAKGASRRGARRTATRRRPRSIACSTRSRRGASRVSRRPSGGS